MKRECSLSKKVNESSYNGNKPDWTSDMHQQRRQALAGSRQV
jgi:hypothetical protein